MKKIRFYYLKFVTFLLTTIGFLVGFSTKIIAQYGAPMITFFLKGKVFAKNTNKPIPQVYIAQYFGDEVYTDENGAFVLPVYTDWGATDNLYFEDKDGELNGEFSPKVIAFKSPKKNDDTLEIEVFLQEKIAIKDIIKTYNLPIDKDGKKITYKKVVYLSYSFTEINITSQNENSYEGNLFFNEKSILISNLSKDKIKQTIEISNEVNTLFINTDVKEQTSQNIYFGFKNYFDTEVTLNQTDTEIEAIIMILLKKDE